MLKACMMTRLPQVINNTSALLNLLRLSGRITPRWPTVKAPGLYLHHSFIMHLKKYLLCFNVKEENILEVKKNKCAETQFKYSSFSTKITSTQACYSAISVMLKFIMQTC